MQLSEASSPVKSISPHEFDGLMACLGPFEKHPDIAIACSGGPDSMALALLGNTWAASKGGSVTALIVDHGLRRGSAEEAQLVLQRLNVCGVQAVVLERGGGSILNDIQAKARDARYGLMTKWCADHGVLHLLFGHHCMDQVETLLLRMERGSGVYGLSGMAGIREAASIRILRPLLSLPKARLRATVNDFGVDVVNDPSNDNSKFDRVRIRRSLTESKSGPSIAKLYAMTARMGTSRAALEDAVADVLARTCEIFPEGYCLLDWDTLVMSPLDIRHRALARIMACIGGNSYTPRYKNLRNLDNILATESLGGGRTLAGCRILRWKSKLLICREPSAIQNAVKANGTVSWDGRYRIKVSGAPDGVVICKLGTVRLATSGGLLEKALIQKIPAAVRPSLPTLWRGEQLLTPHFTGSKDIEIENSSDYRVQITFAPRNPLTSARFTFA